MDMLFVIWAAIAGSAVIVMAACPNGCPIICRTFKKWCPAGERE